MSTTEPQQAWMTILCNEMHIKAAKINTDQNKEVTTAPHRCILTRLYGILKSNNTVKLRDKYITHVVSESFTFFIHMYSMYVHDSG